MPLHAPAGLGPPARPPRLQGPALPKTESTGSGPHALGGHALPESTGWPPGESGADEGAELPGCERGNPRAGWGRLPAPRCPPRIPSGRYNLRQEVRTAPLQGAMRRRGELHRPKDRQSHAQQLSLHGALAGSKPRVGWALPEVTRHRSGRGGGATARGPYVGQTFPTWRRYGVCEGGSRRLRDQWLTARGAGAGKIDRIPNPRPGRWLGSEFSGRRL